MSDEMFSRPYFRKLAFRPFRDPRFLLLAGVIIFPVIFSGCASVSAGNSAAEPAAAKISIVPQAIDFKEVVVGQKNSQTVKITNSTSQSVNLGSLHVSGNGFSLAAVKAPVLLAAGSHIELSVVFAPPSAAGQTGALVISGPDLKAPMSVPLSGEGEKAAPALAVSPASVNFGARMIKTSTSQSVILTNTGNLSLSISSVSVANPVFSVSGISKGVTLSPGQKLEFQVWFHPTATGKAAATISLDSSAGATPVKLAVAGSASTSPTSTPASTAAHSVTLDWNNGSSSTKGYHVYRGEVAGGPFTRLDAALLESTSYKDTAVIGGGHYFYVVTAVGAGGSESAYSNEVSVEIPSD
jgi:Transmembrane protein 131-like N-terminal/Abnormal spindle-like microcephaly-assoc'd, ASPM-SPD-2-Hydin